LQVLRNIDPGVSGSDALNPSKTQTYETDLSGIMTYSL